MKKYLIKNYCQRGIKLIMDNKFQLKLKNRIEINVFYYHKSLEI